MSLPKNKDFNDYDNYITDTNPTTSAQAQDYFRTQAALLKAVIDTEYWQPETNYANGAVVKSDSMPAGTEAICVAVNGGVSSNVEPQWGSVGGANISDGTCFWHLRYRAVSVNNIEADNKGNITIPVMRASTNIASGADGLVPAPPATSNELFLSNDGEWKEAGKVKSVNGKTGDVVVDLPVGHMYWSVEPNVPAGRLPAMGATYNRALYADLWSWANSVGLVKSESEWQAIANANDGNCAYYSSGDGITTFRVPSIKCWVRGANSVDEVGSYLQAGLPDHKHTTTLHMDTSDGAGYNKLGAGRPINYDTTFASEYNPIYGNSDTVQPPSLVGMWLIVAFGVAHNVGNTDVENVMQAIERVQTATSDISDYIVESYRNDTEWYEVYKSGKVRQGGRASIAAGMSIPPTNVTLMKAYIDNKYDIQLTNMGMGYITVMVIDSVITNTSFTIGKDASGNGSSAGYCHWIAEGQGA